MNNYGNNFAFDAHEDQEKLVAPYKILSRPYYENVGGQEYQRLDEKFHDANYLIILEAGDKLVKQLRFSHLQREKKYQERIDAFERKLEEAKTYELPYKEFKNYFERIVGQMGILSGQISTDALLNPNHFDKGELFQEHVEIPSSLAQKDMFIDTMSKMGILELSKDGYKVSSKWLESSMTIDRMGVEEGKSVFTLNPQSVVFYNKSAEVRNLHLHYPKMLYNALLELRTSSVVSYLNRGSDIDITQTNICPNMRKLSAELPAMLAFYEGQLANYLEIERRKNMQKGLGSVVDEETLSNQPEYKFYKEPIAFIKEWMDYVSRLNMKRERKVRPQMLRNAAGKMVQNFNSEKFRFQSNISHVSKEQEEYLKYATHFSKREVKEMMRGILPTPKINSMILAKTYFDSYKSKPLYGVTQQEFEEFYGTMQAKTPLSPEIKDKFQKRVEGIEKTGYVDYHVYTYCKIVELWKELEGYGEGSTIQVSSLVQKVSEILLRDLPTLGKKDAYGLLQNEARIVLLKELLSALVTKVQEKGAEYFEQLEVMIGQNVIDESGRSKYRVSEVKNAVEEVKGNLKNTRFHIRQFDKIREYVLGQEKIIEKKIREIPTRMAETGYKAGSSEIKLYEIKWEYINGLLQTLRTALGETMIDEEESENLLNGDSIYIIAEKEIILLNSIRVFVTGGVSFQQLDPHVQEKLLQERARYKQVTRYFQECGQLSYDQISEKAAAFKKLDSDAQKIVESSYYDWKADEKIISLNGLEYLSSDQFKKIYAKCIGDNFQPYLKALKLIKDRDIASLKEGRGVAQIRSETQSGVRNTITPTNYQQVGERTVVLERARDEGQDIMRQTVNIKSPAAANIAQISSFVLGQVKWNDLSNDATRYEIAKLVLGKGNGDVRKTQFSQIPIGELIALKERTKDQFDWSGIF